MNRRIDLECRRSAYLDLSRFLERYGSIFGDTLVARVTTSFSWHVLSVFLRRDPEYYIRALLKERFTSH